MTDLTTLSRLLSSQEARDAAPCVEYQDKGGEWRILRSGAIQYPHLHPECNHSWAFNPDGSCKHGRLCDIIWSGDLPALLAEAAGLEAKLREGLRKMSASPWI